MTSTSTLAATLAVTLAGAVLWITLWKKKKGQSRGRWVRVRALGVRLSPLRMLSSRLGFAEYQENSPVTYLRWSKRAC